MPFDSAPPALIDSIAHVYRYYAALMSLAPTQRHLAPAQRQQFQLAQQQPLGGTLLYAGALDADGSALAIAGNIAGVATLAAASDQAAARQAMRNGAVDFVVTTLDEALRILKNQVRKREPVSVCVGLQPEEMEREMIERGVQPDLLPPVEVPQSGSLAGLVALGARCLSVQPLSAGQTLFTFEIPMGAARESARIENIMAEAIEKDDFIRRRWLHLSPRYLGPNARRVRSLTCDAETASSLRQQLGCLDTTNLN